MPINPRIIQMPFLSKVANRIAPFVAIFFVLLFQYFFLFRGRIPGHDTLFQFETFGIFYSSLLHFHEIPLWLPYYNYGTPSNYFLMLIAPSSFIVSGIGMLIEYKNVLNLFYASILLEEFVFLIGIYFLARKLYSNFHTAVFITASSALSIFPLWQICFDFRLVIWIPYLLYFSIRLVESKDVKYIFALGIVLILSMIGQAAYFLPMVAVYVGLFIVIYVWANNKSIKFLDLSTTLRSSTLPAFGVFFVLSGLFAWLHLHQFDQQSLYAPGRATGSVMVSRDVFLSWGFPPDLRKFFEFIYAIPSNPDSRIFIGYIPFVFVIYAIVAVNIKKYAPFLGVSLFLILMSFSQLTFVAPFLYDALPILHVFRHIGLFLGASKILLLIVAGFGFEHFLSRVKQTRFSSRWNRWKKRLFITISVVFLLTIVFFDVIFSGSLPYKEPWLVDFVSSQQLHYVNFAALALLILLILRSPKKIKHLAIFIIILHSSEMLSYQNFLFSTNKLFRPTTDKKYFHSNLIYQPNRVFSDHLPSDILAADEALRMGVLYRIHDSWINFDTCIPRLRSEVRSSSIDNLIKTLHPDAPTSGDEMLWPSADELNRSSSLSAAFGCNSPKLRFISSYPSARALLVNTEISSSNIVNSTAANSAALTSRDTALSTPILNNSAPTMAAEDISLPALTHEQTRDETNRLLHGKTDFGFTVLRCPDNTKAPCLFLVNSVKSPISDSIRVYDMTYNSIKLSIDVNNKAGGWLIYSDSWSKDWKALVDEKEELVMEADIGFKAIKLEAGKHDIAFRFRGIPYTKTIFTLYMILSSIILIYILVYLMMNRSRSERIDSNINLG